MQSSSFIDHRGKSRSPRTDSERRMALAQAEAQKAAAGNRCPRCGGAVRRNLAISGWVQCAQHGSPGFRADPTAPSCSWQGFTR